MSARGGVGKEGGRQESSPFPRTHESPLFAPFSAGHSGTDVKQPPEQLVRRLMHRSVLSVKYKFVHSTISSIFLVPL